MDTLLWIVYFIFASIAIIPVIKLDEIKSNPQYRILWILSVLVFTWAVVVGINLVSTEPSFFYYGRLITYPIIFSVSYAIFVLLQTYTHHKTSRVVHFIAAFFLILNVLISITNTFHLWVLDTSYSHDLAKEVYLQSSRGWFFYLHTTICYVLLLVGFVNMLIYLKKRERNIKDSFPFPMILVSLIVGIVLNIIHIVFYHFSIDPTFIFVVVITFTLYMIIYKRDFNVNLILASRTFLFNKMREMYVIADHKHQIIEYSQNLLERFHTLELNLGDTVNEFYRKLKKQVIYYNDISEIYDIPFDETKTYLHIDDQAYQIDRFEASGELILLYDETLAIRMMNEIDIIRSHDQMSHVYNRNYFEENRLRLEKEYPYLGLILIDVDGLKLLNDYLGHHEGDQLIIRFANILLKLEKVYSDLLPIRFGGDEFVVIAKRADQKKLDDIIRRIEEGAMHPNPLLNISFSYGIAVRQPNEQIRSMLKRADGCLYEMKSKKSNYKEAFIKALKEASKDEDSAND